MPAPNVRHLYLPCVAAMLLAATTGHAQRATPAATATPATILDLAITRMGEAAALRRIERVRFEQMTLWHRQTWEDRPYGDLVGSYERVSDLRDYTIPAWRNTRRPISAAPTPFEFTDLVRDSVAARFAPTGPSAPSAWAPLNIAYLDERRELFAFAPERLLLAARGASDLAALSDTTIDGVPHARLAATVDRYPSVVFIRRTDGFPALVRYRAAQPNDFGLAPFGEMEVELWYGAWRTVPVTGSAGVTYPMQWDMTRSGRPYKRITLLSARFDLPAHADSFTVSDDLRRGFVATASRPMWDLPLDSARVVDGRFVQFGLPGQSASAVKIGKQWVLLEATTVPTRVEGALAWLRRTDPSARLGATLVATTGNVPGGLAWFTRQRLPAYVGSGATRSARTVLRNWQAPSATLHVIDTGRWLIFDGDSLWVEPMHLPGNPGGLIAWVPSLRWVYQPMAVTPLQTGLVMEHVRQRGWPAERFGSLRAVVAPMPAAPASR